jgi:hypothetical protein
MYSTSAPNPDEVPGCQEADVPCERIFAFFRCGGSSAVGLRWRDLTSFPDAGADSAWLLHTRIEGSLTMAIVSAERRQRCPLRPRNLSVPSYRPLQRRG